MMYVVFDHSCSSIQSFQHLKRYKTSTHFRLHSSHVEKNY
jgi:hypothetical protein